MLTQHADSNEDVWIPTTCYMCFNCCAVRVHRVDGVVVKIEGNPDAPNSLGRLCAKGLAGMMSLYNPTRLKYPMKRTNPEKGIGVDPKWKRISWDEALDEIAERLRKIRSEDPRKLIVSTFDFHGFEFWAAFAAGFGTPNTSTISAGYYCGNGFHPVTYLVHGSTFGEPDIWYTDYCILIGTQNGFLSNHLPVDLAQRVSDARMRGMKVVVVDPVCTNAASKADEWIPIRPGTDAALALSMVNVLLNELGVYDAEFLKIHTNAPYLIGEDEYYVRDSVSEKPLVWDSVDNKAKPYDDFVKDYALEGIFEVNGKSCKPAFQCLKNHVKKYTPEMASDITTVPATTIRRIAKEFGSAAKIGSKITIDGKELPLRPAVVSWYRGAIAHKHGMLNGLACVLLNLIIGAIDVPGGHVGVSPAGPWWTSKIGPDGLLVPGEAVATMPLAFPARRVKPPESIQLTELFPVAPYSRSMLVQNLLHQEEYGFPYRCEAMIHSRSNFMMTAANPQEMAEAFKKIPFIVALAIEIDESAEMADIVLPDTHFLERLDAFPNGPQEFIAGGQGSWYWLFRQPVVEPAFEARHWQQVLLEIADRVGFSGDLYIVLNELLRLKGEHRLESDKKYSWEEIADRMAQSWFGAEHNLNWFKEWGFLVSRRKTVEEAYQRHFVKSRIPIYFEHLKEAGGEVKKVTREMGLDWWDTSDYQPIPDWKPCPDYEIISSEYDLFPINFKIPTHTFTYTQSNPWLNELGEHDPIAYNIVLNKETAAKKRLKEGDRVFVQGIVGYKVEGKLKVTELIHPEVVGIAGCFGNWAQGRIMGRRQGANWNTLIPHGSSHLERYDMLAATLDQCTRVKVCEA